MNSRGCCCCYNLGDEVLVEECLGKRQELSIISQINIFILLIFRGLLVQMAGQWAAASSCQFPNFPDLRVRPSLRLPTGAVGAVEAGNLLHGKLLHCSHCRNYCPAENITLQKLLHC